MKLAPTSFFKANSQAIPEITRPLLVMATAGTTDGELVEFSRDIDPVNLAIFLQDNGILSDVCNVLESKYRETLTYEY